MTPDRTGQVWRVEDVEGVYVDGCELLVLVVGLPRALSDVAHSFHPVAVLWESHEGFSRAMLPDCGGRLGPGPFLSELLGSSYGYGVGSAGATRVL